MNLLDLPVIFLEDLLGYCVERKKRSLTTLTECSSSFKNLIETSPRLMKFLCLNVRANHPKMADHQKEFYKVCMNSTRRYQAVSLNVYGESESDSNKIEEDPEYSLKKLVDKHAETIKDFTLSFDSDKEVLIADILKCLENLQNVEKITLDLKTYSEIINAPENFELSFANNFSNLKFLNLDVDHPIVFDVLKDCITLTSLRLKAGPFLMDLSKFHILLVNSEKTLQSLTLDFKDEEYEDEVEGSNIRAAQILRKLKDLKLNLKFFEFNLEKINNNNLIALMDFLGSQENLETFKYDGWIDLNFFDHFQRLLPAFKNLKCFSVNYLFNNDDIDREERAERSRRAWDLRNLKTVELMGITDCATNVYQKMFSSFSEKLEVIHLKNAYLPSLKNITINYPNLTELCLEECEDYSCNEIFLIMKSLKKLRILEFEFHEQTRFKPSMFENNEDLTLPEIQKVRLFFNSYIKDRHIKIFMQYMKNMSDFYFKYWTGEMETLGIIIKEVPNLKNLSFSKLCFDSDEDYIWESQLEEIESYVKMHNKNPGSFKLQGKSFKDNLVESKAKADYEPKSYKYYNYYNYF